MSIFLLGLAKETKVHVVRNRKIKVMHIIQVSALFGFFLMILINFSFSRKRTVNKYKNMGEQELTNLKIFAERMTKIVLIMVFIILPVLMGFILPVFYKTTSIGDYVVSFGLLVVFIGIALSRIYWDTLGSAKVELEHRSKKKRVRP